MQKGKVEKERIAEKVQGISWRTETSIKECSHKKGKGEKENIWKGKYLCEKNAQN